jgi:hypothetical protein
VFDQITKCYDLGVQARQNQRAYEAAQVQAEKGACGRPEQPEKERNQVAKCKEGAAIWKNVAETFEAWSKQGTTADDKGNVPLANVIRQGSVKQKLTPVRSCWCCRSTNRPALATRRKISGPSLGANPFYVMGGVVAGFTLFQGAEGKVIASRRDPVARRLLLCQ